MTKLPDDKVAEIRAYADRGWSSTATSIATGHSIDIVKKYYREYQTEIGRYLMCGCGKRLNHAGTCKFRYDQMIEAEKLRPLPEGWTRMESEADERTVERLTQAIQEEPKLPPLTLPPMTKTKSSIVRSNCPKGFCEMLLDHVTKIGSYEIEYFKCTCNEERVERRVAQKLSEAV